MCINLHIRVFIYVQEPNLVKTKRPHIHRLFERTGCPLLLSSKPKQAQNKKTHNPDGNHTEPIVHLRMIQGPSLLQHVAHRHRGHGERKDIGKVAQHHRHALERPQETAQNDHRIKCTGGHKVGHRMRIAEHGDQQTWYVNKSN